MVIFVSVPTYTNKSFPHSGHVVAGAGNAFCFATTEMLDIMATCDDQLHEEETTLASDATFKVVPSMFYQLLTICLIRNRHVCSKLCSISARLTHK